MKPGPSYRIFETTQFDKDLRNIARAGHAEVFGLTELVTEDFQAERLYGSVRIVNPFS